MYQRRQDIELAFRLVKQCLHLPWSSKPQVVLVQVCGVLMFSQAL